MKKGLLIILLFLCADSAQATIGMQELSDSLMNYTGFSRIWSPTVRVRKMRVDGNHIVIHTNATLSGVRWNEEKAKITVSTGFELVNIYFQPCNDNYARTEISLYKDNMMLAKYKVDEETFFKSITGLAYGKYSFVLKQFDKDNTILLETEHIEFTIYSPKTHGIMPEINVI